MYIKAISVKSAHQDMLKLREFLLWFSYRFHFFVNYYHYSKISIKFIEIWSVLRNIRIISLRNEPGYALAFDL